MSDTSLLTEELEEILEALERIPSRFAGVENPADFTNSLAGREHLDAICMVLMAAGEAFKKIDRRTEGRLLSRCPAIDWAGVKGMRDVIAHGYFDIDAAVVFEICRRDVPTLTDTVRVMIKEIGGEVTE
jgi:uncharacterized protein with HEPN domain